MKILMVSSEASPWMKTGGLADVMSALPKLVSQKSGFETALVLPYYASIKNNANIRTEQLLNFRIPFAWKSTYVGLHRLIEAELPYEVYFIDNNDYFLRENPYGYFDDGERFAYFAKAVAAAFARLDWKPDIISCHDWETALIPVLVKTRYRNCFPHTKTILTIHNVDYQGIADADFGCSVLGFDEEESEAICFDGNTNFLKAGIIACDKLTTVSETYAEELQTPEIGGRLCTVFRERADDFIGITNGIDTSDRKAYPLFEDSSAMISCRREAKTALQKYFGLACDPDIPVLGIVTRLAEHKGIELICQLADCLLPDGNVQITVCGSGEGRYEYALNCLEEKYPGRIGVFTGFSNATAAMIYSGCDIYLMPSRSEPCGLSQMIAMKCGAVPVVHAVGGLKDTVVSCEADRENGNGFLFSLYDLASFSGKVISAMKLYSEEPEEWNRISYHNHCMNFGWEKAVDKYCKLYEGLYKQ